MSSVSQRIIERLQRFTEWLKSESRDDVESYNHVPFKVVGKCKMRFKPGGKLKPRKIEVDSNG